MTIIKYFNKLSGVYNNFGYASRIASQTSSIYEASGGSRINFIQSPYWVGVEQTVLYPQIVFTYRV